MEKATRRFFIALPVDDEKSLESLSGIFKHLNKNRQFFKIVPMHNYHITIKFFGSLNPETSESLLKSLLLLNQLKQVEYKIRGIGAFPSANNPSVIWAGLQCNENPLNEIIKSAETLAASIGIPPENRKFIPHLTLARVKKEEKIPAEFELFLNENKDLPFASSVFKELILYESILKNTGAEYKKIEVIKLI